MGKAHMYPHNKEAGGEVIILVWQLFKNELLQP